MAWIAVGVGGAALLGSVTSGFLQSNAQKSASNQQAQSQKNANDTNWKEFQQSRGSTGSAVLPTYLTNPGGGGLFEGTLGNDLVNAYSSSNVPLSTFQNSTSFLAPAQAGAEKFTNDIFNGGITRTLTQEAAPVQAAKLASARQNSMDALNKTLAAIDAAQAGKGFSGDAYGNRLLQFQGRKATGDAVSAANISNLGETQQIQNYGNVTLPMQNLSLPANMANQAGAFAFSPQSNYLSSINQRVAPFNFLRIGTGTPPAVQPLPTAPPNAGLGGAIAGGVAQGGGAALNYYLGQQAYQNQLGLANATTPYENTTGPDIWAGTTPAPPIGYIPGAT